MTLAINLLLVTRTMTPWRWEAAKDRRNLKGTNRWYLRPPNWDMDAGGVIWTAIKSCILRHPTHTNQRPLRTPKLSGCAGCLWMQLFMVVPMTPSAAGYITDLSRFAERTDLCCQYSLLSVKNLSAVSLKPAITFFLSVVDTDQKFAEIFANECLLAVSTPPR